MPEQDGDFAEVAESADEATDVAGAYRAIDVGNVKVHAFRYLEVGVK